jgi:hypothetical protein
MMSLLHNKYEKEYKRKIGKRRKEKGKQKLLLMNRNKKIKKMLNGNLV